MKQIFVLALISMTFGCAHHKSEVATVNDCAFVERIESLAKLGPYEALSENIFGSPAPFLSVADGIGPSRHGIGEGDEAACVMDNYEFLMIWAGADYIRCEGQLKSAAKAREFTRAYNELLRRKLSSDNIYKCTDKHLMEERRRRCAATGQELCSGLEDWRGAHLELARFVWNLDSTSTTGYRPEEYGKFSVSIRNLKHRDEIEKNACNIFPKYGIKMDVTIYMELANFNHQDRKWDKEKLKEVLCSY